MKVITLKTFLNVDRVVQPGQTIEVEEGRGIQLINNKLVAPLEGDYFPSPAEPDFHPFAQEAPADETPVESEPVRPPSAWSRKHKK